MQQVPEDWVLTYRVPGGRACRIGNLSLASSLTAVVFQAKLSSIRTVLLRRRRFRLRCPEQFAVSTPGI